MRVYTILGLLLSMISLWLLLLSAFAPPFMQFIADAQYMTSFVAASCSQPRKSPLLLFVLILFNLTAAWTAVSMMEHNVCDAHIRRANQTIGTIVSLRQVNCSFVAMGMRIISSLNAYLQVILLFVTAWDVLHRKLARRSSTLPPTSHCIVIALLLCCTASPLYSTFHFGLSPSNAWMHVVAYITGLYLGRGVCAIAWLVACTAPLSCRGIQFPTETLEQQCLRLAIVTRTCQVVALACILFSIYMSRHSCIKCPPPLQRPFKPIKIHSRRTINAAPSGPSKPY